MVQQIIPRDDFDVATILRESKNIDSWYQTACEAIDLAAEQAKEQVMMQKDRRYNKTTVRITTWLIKDEDYNNGDVLDTFLNTTVHK